MYVKLPLRETHCRPYYQHSELTRHIDQAQPPPTLETLQLYIAVPSDEYTSCTPLPPLI
jgi:hypothetical protein